MRRGQSVRRLLMVVICLGAVQLHSAWQPLPAPALVAVTRATRGQRFNLTAWEVEAVAGKLADGVRRPAATLSEVEGEALVRDYLQMARRAGELAGEIERLYSDPTLADAAAASAAQRHDLAVLQVQLTEQAAIVEAVLQEQLSTIIVAEGLTTAGLVWPPVRMRFSEPPALLVVSPRSRIERLRSVDLLPDLNSAQWAAIEQEVTANDPSLSAYVTGIGGYGVYPTMVVDRYGLPWSAETIAHEWIHNYLAFRPLGWSFLEGGPNVTINETVASIAGEELGRALLARYYPDLLPPPVAAQADPAPKDPNAFDFNVQMHQTRLRVDELLAAGQVDEAEAYMEAQRQVFVAHGYALRVLNQAYFAFHGSYATGAAASDPIGPKLVRLRAASASLRDFLHTVEGITSVAELDAALGE
ncbi:MAG: hypothetical protein ABTQ73_09670 [Caldilineales bacterium]